MNQKGFTNIALVVLVIIILLGVVGYFTLMNKPASPNNVINQQQTNNPVTPTIQDETVNWKTYRNDKFGFEFKYPVELTAVSSGPNDEQKRLDRGEMISGTIPCSYDTVTFSDSAGKERFDVIIKGTREEISPAGFKGYLSMGSTCDTRWIDSVSEGPTLINKKGVPILEVQVISGGPRGGSSAGCYYFKNSKGNLIVFNISGFEQKSDFLNVFPLVGDKVLSTLNLIK